MNDDKTPPAPGLDTDTSPLGRSAEEVETEAGNRTNAPTAREDLLERPLPPAPVLGGVSETGLVAGDPAVPVMDNDAGGDTIRPDAGRGDEATDSDEA